MEERIELPYEVGVFLDEVKRMGEDVVDVINDTMEMDARGAEVTYDWLYSNERSAEDRRNQILFAQAWIVGWESPSVKVKTDEGKWVVYIVSNSGIHITFTSNKEMATNFPDHRAAGAVAELVNGHVI